MSAIPSCVTYSKVWDETYICIHAKKAVPLQRKKQIADTGSYKKR